MKYIWTTALLTAVFLSSYARLQLPAIFSAKMILQRHQAIFVWGISDAGHPVSVLMHKIRITVPAGPDGRWKAALPSMEAGGPYTIVVSNANGDSITIADVLIGEVWICAGQSNMNFILAGDRSDTVGIPSGRTLSPSFSSGRGAFSNERIRQFRCDMPPGVLNPENSRHSRWAAAMGDEIHNFSAVAFYFASRLQRSLHVPVGIVIMACGSTRAESWTNPELLTEKTGSAMTTEDDALKPFFAYQARHAFDKDIPPNLQPGLFYTDVVRPVAGYTAAGLIWYQGESNTLPDNSGRPIRERADEYKPLLKRVIKSFRTAWANERWPIVLVQLPNYEDLSGDLQWARIRQSQLEVSREVSHVLLVVTIDVGDAGNIHPDHKRPVGERAACQALVGVYRLRAPVRASGPLAKKIAVTPSGIVVYFEHTGKGLEDRHPGADGGLQGFEVAYASDSTRFMRIHARIEGDHVAIQPPAADGQVAASVKTALGYPAYIRYGWSDNPVAGLFNDSGLPASPFLLPIPFTKNNTTICSKYPAFRSQWR